MRNGRVALPSTLMSVEEVMQAAGVGKNTAYQIIKKLTMPNWTQWASSHSGDG